MTNMKDDRKEAPKPYSNPVDSVKREQFKLSPETKLVMCLGCSMVLCYALGKRSGYRRGLMKGELEAYSKLMGRR